ncbi:pyridoxamine 5'-phosphate oxidase family protein [Stappia stellulata]|uniref:pyridoxamine 5'-phosphate oxidase family protein n=1 Tax=Stappia stellulata TaxID=71235 RepID=UPI0003F894E9|nr:pyridoxamine 5'-phosphate oxidase family protein [Stappia stellulata]
MTDTDLKQSFWNRLDDVRAGFLAAESERPVPMSPMPDQEANAIWFITAAGSAADRAAKSGGEASFYVTDPKANFYANIAGKLEETNDAAKLDELWSAMAAAWFPNGRNDDAVRLVKFSPHEGEIWATDGGAAYLYEIAKANMTDSMPDVGEHGRVTF